MTTGVKHVAGRDVTLVAKDIRADIKAACASGQLQLPPHTQVSVTCRRYSLGQSIDIIVTGLVRDELWCRNVSGHRVRTYLHVATFNVLNGILESYNRNDSDVMTDLYDVEFSGSVRFSVA